MTNLLVTNEDMDRCNEWHMDYCSDDMDRCSEDMDRSKEDVDRSKEDMDAMVQPVFVATVQPISRANAKTYCQAIASKANDLAISVVQFLGEYCQAIAPKANDLAISVVQFLREIIIETGKYLFIILAFLRKPFVVAMASFLSIAIISIACQFFLRSGVAKHLMFRPVSVVFCRMPVVQHFAICSSQPKASDTYKQLTSIQEYTFEGLSENVLTHSNTVIDLAQLSARTLPDLVRRLEHSDIASRSALVDAFNEVIDFGTPTMRNLQDFAVTVRSSLDTIIATNKATMNRLQQPNILHWLPWNTRSEKNVQLLWSAIVRFGREVDIINDSFVKARDSLQEFQGLLNAALAIVSDELHLETLDRENAWNSLSYRIGWDNSKVMSLNREIALLEKALHTGGEGIDYIVQARVVMEGAHDGFMYLKRQVDLEIDSNNEDMVELQFAIIAESITRLSELRVNGFGKKKTLD